MRRQLILLAAVVLSAIPLTGCAGFARLVGEMPNVTARGYGNIDPNRVVRTYDMRIGATSTRWMAELDDGTILVCSSDDELQFPTCNPA